DDQDGEPEAEGDVVVKDDAKD
ncbi:MAG: hypothetical protein QOJ97_3050, partial [Solirubrobacteraceae bacterium]|nr:hypothetical protein [Solirubrobacteraceae bacterium]